MTFKNPIYTHYTLTYYTKQNMPDFAIKDVKTTKSAPVNPSHIKLSHLHSKP